MTHPNFSFTKNHVGSFLLLNKDRVKRSGINELFKVVFLFFLCSCSCVVFVTLEKEKDLGENMLSRLCSDCLPFLQIGLFQANIDIFLDLLSCHHLARLFEVVFRRNLQKYVRGKLKIRDDFVLY